MPRNYETRELDFNSDDGFGADVASDDPFAPVVEYHDCED